MSKIFFSSLVLLWLFLLSYQLSFAEMVDWNTTAWIYNGLSDSDRDVTSDIRNGNFTMDDIPKIIAWVIEILLAIAGTVSIVALIYHAVKMQLASGITGDSSGVDKAKAGMKWALLGFALALSAWFLITKFVELLATNT